MTRQKPRNSPYRWLWGELERRFGSDVAQEIKAGYSAQSKAYHRAIWDTPAPAGSKLKPGRKKKRGK